MARGYGRVVQLRQLPTPCCHDAVAFGSRPVNDRPGGDFHPAEWTPSQAYECGGLPALRGAPGWIPVAVANAAGVSRTGSLGIEFGSGRVVRFEAGCGSGPSDGKTGRPDLNPVVAFGFCMRCFWAVGGWSGSWRPTAQWGGSSNRSGRLRGAGLRLLACRRGGALGQRQQAGALQTLREFEGAVRGRGSAGSLVARYWYGTGAGVKPGPPQASCGRRLCLQPLVPPEGEMAFTPSGLGGTRSTASLGPGGIGPSMESLPSGRGGTRPSNGRCPQASSPCGRLWKAGVGDDWRAPAHNATWPTFDWDQKPADETWVHREGAVRKGGAFWHGLQGAGLQRRSKFKEIGLSSSGAAVRGDPYVAWKIRGWIPGRPWGGARHVGGSVDVRAVRATGARVGRPPTVVVQSGVCRQKGYAREKEPGRRGPGSAEGGMEDRTQDSSDQP